MITLLNNDAIEIIEIYDKDFKAKRSLRLIDITDVTQVLSNEGYPLSNRTQLDIRNKEPLIAIGRYQLFRDLVFNNKADYSTNIGFKKYEYNKNNSTSI